MQISYLCRPHFEEPWEGINFDRVQITVTYQNDYETHVCCSVSVVNIVSLNRADTRFEKISRADYLGV